MPVPTRRNITRGSIMKSATVRRAKARHVHQWIPNHCCRIPKCVSPLNSFPHSTSPIKAKSLVQSKYYIKNINTE